jgi:hypothetical protein
MMLVRDAAEDGDYHCRKESRGRAWENAGRSTQGPKAYMRRRGSETRSWPAKQGTDGMRWTKQRQILWAGGVDPIAMLTAHGQLAVLDQQHYLQPYLLRALQARTRHFWPLAQALEGASSWELALARRSNIRRKRESVGGACHRLRNVRHSEHLECDVAGDRWEMPCGNHM